uniref:Anticodon-binding domain-containing protein n=1 Tax=Anolis carolinensis TaxID=28377 RepID=A0A803T1U7_ANOCA|nr:PREDICTED: nuclear receptor coactivator 5 isoform X1 [Anolis carolinensis]|eukprot:XP_003224045.1 PREDICTED: nuclear receptor coactivator 5 isoform X1 [Anolis carolinensis]
MSSWVKVTTDKPHAPDPEKRHRQGKIPRLLDKNPFETITKSSYSPPDGYSEDYEDANRHRQGKIPRLLDKNPFETITKSSYSPPDGYSEDYEDANRHRQGKIPRLLDKNPFETITKSSYSPPDGYSEDYEDANSFEELFGQQYPSGGNEDNYERYHYSQKDDDYTKDVHREKLYLQFYQQVEKECDKGRPSDCVIVSFSKDQSEYSTVIGHRLQDRGLVVEMIYLTSESGLARALQDVKNDGSPFCVLVEPANVALTSCTAIMLHQYIKIHRNMPMDDALALITKEFEKINAERGEQERTKISHKAADLVDDYLERELYESYHVPLAIRHLLFLLSEGKHLYAEELNSVSDYLKTRRNKLEGFVAEANSLSTATEKAAYPPSVRPSTSSLPQTLSKPPPLLPMLGCNPALSQSSKSSAKPALLGERPLGALLPTPALTGPKGKPPPLLTKSVKRPIHLTTTPPPHLPAKRPLLGSRPGLLPTPATQARSAHHHWVPKPKFLA